MKGILDISEYEESVDTLRKWAKGYYHDDDPIATDEEYDVLYHRVMRYELNNNIANLDSPTHFVGWPDK